MDKLKQQLGPVLKHFFWICIGVLAVTVLGSWWMSTSALEAQRTAQESAISSKFQAMDSLMGKAPKHPNPSTDAEMKKGLDASMKDVVLAWKKQYDRQKNIFVWPSQLRPETRAAFEPLTPIEAKVDFPETAAQKVDTPWREDYANYISGRLPELAKIVKARWSVDFKSSTSGGGGSEMAFGGAGNFGAPATGFASLATTPKIDDEPPPLVQWSSDSQAKLLNQVFPWRARVPKTLEVLYSQESLWILEALLNIIASVNGDARFNPPIKQINGITLGRGASTFAGRVTPFGTVVPGGYEGGSGSGSDMYSATAGSESGMNMPTTGGGAVVAEADPGTGRYVNEDYVAVEVSQLRTVLSSAQPSPADASLVVAKRVPVKLNLLMDQRKVIELLTACGNARLMVEVRQVRWLPNTGAAPAAISGTESGANGGGNMENSMRGSGYGSGAATATAAAGPIISQNDVPIEIAGIVYVFNKTDEKKLGLEQIDENFNLETTSPTAPEPTDATPNEPALPTAEPVANPVAAVTPPEAGATAVAPTASATPVAQPPGATPPPE